MCLLIDAWTTVDRLASKPWTDFEHGESECTVFDFTNLSTVVHLTIWVGYDTQVGSLKFNLCTLWSRSHPYI
jgi:hypothetical protein